MKIIFVESSSVQVGHKESMYVRSYYFILLQSKINRQFSYERKIHTTRLEYCRVKHGVKKNVFCIAEHGSSTDVDFILHQDQFVKEIISKSSIPVSVCLMGVENTS